MNETDQESCLPYRSACIATANGSRNAIHHYTWMHPRPRTREVMKQVNTIGTDLDLMDADSSNRSYLWSTDPVLWYRKACTAGSYGSGLLSTWAEVFDEDMDYMNAEVFDLLFMDYLCRGGIHRRRYLMVFVTHTKYFL